MYCLSIYLCFNHTQYDIIQKQHLIFVSFPYIYAYKKEIASHTLSDCYFFLTL